MTKQEKPSRRKRSKTIVTIDDLVVIIKQIIEFDGLDAARKKYEEWCVTFAPFPAWHEAATEILSVLNDERKRLLAEEQERKKAQEQAASGGANLYILNNNEQGIDERHYSIGHLDQMNGILEKGAHVTHTKLGGRKE